MNVIDGATIVLVGTAEGKELKRSFTNLIGLATGSAGDAAYQLPPEQPERHLNAQEKAMEKYIQEQNRFPDKEPQLRAP